MITSIKLRMSLGGCIAAAFLLPASASAETIGVTTTADETTINGFCSLREAVSSADANGSIDCTPGEDDALDTVVLGAFAYELAGANPLFLQSTTETDAAGTKIVGTGMGSTTITGAVEPFGDSLLKTQSSSPLALEDLTISAGGTGNAIQGGGIQAITNSLALTRVQMTDNTAQYGGAIYFQPNLIDHPSARLTINGSTIDSNHATPSTFFPNSDAYGGGIYATGPATITDSTISGNTVSQPTAQGAFGGGIHTHQDLTLTGTTISGNTAAGTTHSVGAGLNFQGTTLTAVNSTFSGNTVSAAGGTRAGGAINLPFGTTAKLSNVTLAGNSASVGSAIANLGTLEIRSSIVDDTTDGCVGPATSLGDNIDSIGNCTPTDAALNDLGGTATNLDTLKDNGGPTETRALLTGSPAIDHVSAGKCLDQQTPTAQIVTTDQRGFPRPSGASCDAGSYERTECVGAVDLDTGVIMGTPASESIVGTPGNDIVLAGAGNDTINAGLGNDRICGGPGSDTASFAGGAAVSASTVAASGQGADQIAGIEHLIGSSFADVLLGNTLANLLIGGAGPDRLGGGGGNDTVRGGTGNDTETGGSGNDRLYGDGGSDRLSGGSGRDRLSGGTGRDSCSGGSGTDSGSSCSSSTSIP